jgi:catechol 2,3-dioxygenase-like lactoylglutathione lyase family enzyme
MPVPDLARSVAFYRDQLGLEVGYTSESMAEFPTAGLVLDEVAGFERFDVAVTVGIGVDDVDSVFADLEARGVPVAEPPTDQLGESATSTLRTLMDTSSNSSSRKPHSPDGCYAWPTPGGFWPPPQHPQCGHVSAFTRSGCGASDASDLQVARPARRSSGASADAWPGGPAVQPHPGLGGMNAERRENYHVLRETASPEAVRGPRADGSRGGGSDVSVQV